MSETLPPSLNSLSLFTFLAPSATYSNVMTLEWRTAHCESDVTQRLDTYPSLKQQDYDGYHVYCEQFKRDNTRGRRDLHSQLYLPFSVCLVSFFPLAIDGGLF